MFIFHCQKYQQNDTATREDRQLPTAIDKIEHQG